MATILTEKIKDSTTAGPKITLKDSDGDEVIVSAITSIHYTLTDSAGTVINSKDNVSLTVSNPLYIKFEPDDTKYSDGPYRVVTVKWVYTDKNWGANSTHIEEIQVPLEDLLNV